VFFANGVGDHVLCLPAVRALSKALDGAFVLAYPQGPQAFIFDDLQIERKVEISIDSGATFGPRPAASLIGAVDSFISLTSRRPWRYASRMAQASRWPGRGYCGLKLGSGISFPDPKWVGEAFGPGASAQTEVVNRWPCFMIMGPMLIVAGDGPRNRFLFLFHCRPPPV
jgi:hypothetical protein